MNEIDKLMIDLESTLTGLELSTIAPANPILINQINSKGMIEYNDVEGFLGNVWKAIKNFFKKIWNFFFKTKKNSNAALSDAKKNAKEAEDKIKHLIKVKLEPEDILCLFNHYDVGYYNIYRLADVDLPSPNDFDQISFTKEFKEYIDNLNFITDNFDLALSAFMKERNNEELTAEEEEIKIKSIRQQTIAIKQKNGLAFNFMKYFIDKIKKNEKVFESKTVVKSCIDELVEILTIHSNIDPEKALNRFTIKFNVTKNGFSLNVKQKKDGAKDVIKSYDFILNKPTRETLGSNVKNLKVESLSNYLNDFKDEVDKEGLIKEIEDGTTKLVDKMKENNFTTEEINASIQSQTESISAIASSLSMEGKLINEFNTSLRKTIDKLDKGFKEKSMDEQEEIFKKIKESCN